MKIKSITQQIHIGVSSCLLGEHVRYDGGHRHNSYITDIISRYFEFIPFCPEVAVGMGVPRPPMQLVKINHAIRALGVENPNTDMTIALTNYGRQIAEGTKNLSGYIFKARSPSCGIADVNIYDENNNIIEQGQGLFAAQIQAHYPDLPIIDEATLDDEQACEQFIKAVLSYYDRKK